MFSPRSFTGFFFFKKGLIYLFMRDTERDREREREREKEIEAET